MNDRRIPVINHLVDDLHKRLNDLENLYASVNKFYYLFYYILFSCFFFKVIQSSDTRDMMLKQYIEQIYTDLHVRITNDQQQQHQKQKQQQQPDKECSTNTTVVVVTD